MACTGRVITPASNEAVEESGSFRITATEVVDKEEKWNVRTNVQNLTNDKTILFFIRQMHCFRGEHEGALEHAFAGIGERKINIAPASSKSFNFLCSFESAQKSGAFRIEVERIFSNPSGDGATPGATLAKDVVLTVQDQ